MTKLLFNDNILGSVKVVKRRGKAALPILNFHNKEKDMRSKELMRRSIHYLDEQKIERNLKSIPSDKVLHCVQTDKPESRIKKNPYNELF